MYSVSRICKLIKFILERKSNAGLGIPLKQNPTNCTRYDHRNQFDLKFCPLFEIELFLLARNIPAVPEFEASQSFSDK